ncbi:MAG: DUF1858 domain-containing protein [Eggerthellaceae bacterium]|nr:DUF1858 domain-containing protein [Eggerthellaceae bacterium]
MEINGQTKLADILAEYPFMKMGMAEINGKFRMLQTPMGKVMVRKATVADMSERSGMPVDELAAAIAAKVGAAQGSPDGSDPAANPAAHGEPGAGSPDGDTPAWWGKAEGFPVVDVRGAKGNFFPGLKARAEAVPVGEGLTVVQSFEPVPLYDVMEGLGFERATRKAADGEYRAYFYRAGEGSGADGIVFRPVALLNFPMIDGDLADLAVEFWDLTWNDERRHLPQETRLLLSMANALGAGRMRQASRELIKVYALGT